MLEQVKRFFVFVACLLVVACAPEQKVTVNPLPKEAEGKVVVINYWAEWCHPCREEIPELNTLARQQPDKLVVFGVNYDGLTGEALAQVEAKMGIDFATLPADPGPALGLTMPDTLPHTLILDAEGNVERQLQGRQTLESLMQAVAEIGESGSSRNDM